MNIRNKNSASKSVFKFDDVFIKVCDLCKYLGIYVDSKLSFQSHIEYIKKRLSKQCGIICKLRHYVPRKQLIDYYRSNVNPIIQYGILVYGCCSYSSLLPIYILQKKISNSFTSGKGQIVLGTFLILINCLRAVDLLPPLLLQSSQFFLCSSSSSTG